MNCLDPPGLPWAEEWAWKSASHAPLAKTNSGKLRLAGRSGGDPLGVLDAAAAGVRHIVEVALTVGGVL